jgi:hypothetical protein
MIAEKPAKGGARAASARQVLFSTVQPSITPSEALNTAEGQDAVLLHAHR